MKPKRSLRTFPNFFKENYSSKDIMNKLKEGEIDIYVRAITHILKYVGIRRQAVFKEELWSKYWRPRVKRIADFGRL